MKKLFWFAVSLSLAFLLFCLVAFLCFIPSAFADNSDSNGKPLSTDDSSAAESSAEALSVTVIFTENSRTLLCNLSVTPKSGQILSHSTEIGAILSENDELYPFLGQCLEMDNRKCDNYILLDGKNFTEIADISGGIVYNDSLEGERLLTGSQALNELDCKLFENACRQIAAESLTDSGPKIYGYITENTVNFLPYPTVYSAYH